MLRNYVKYSTMLYFQAQLQSQLLPKLIPPVRCVHLKFLIPHNRRKELQLQKVKYINTTSKLNAIPPIILLVLRPIAKISAMLFGRTIRKWWQKLPPQEREKVLSKIRSKQTQISFGITIFFGLIGLFYIEHIEEEPMTKRRRFILYTDEQMHSIAEMEFENQITTFKREIVPPSHPIYARVVRVANRILNANKDLPQIQRNNWAVTVIDRPEITNAAVLPNGKIMIFTGILNVATNDDQLAIVMSHEIAHNLLSHQRENLSKSLLLDTLLLIPLVIFWAILPDAAALFTQWLQGRLADIMINLPFSRALEREADVVGLELAARACYDIREAPVFWGKMAQVNEMPEPVEWLSTHPSNATRQLELSHLLPAAIQIRDACKCPRLPPVSAAQLFFHRPGAP